MKKVLVIIAMIICSLILPIYSSAMPTETRGDDSVTGVSADDAAMNSIIADARKTVSVFIKELSDPNTKGTDFAVKYPFITDKESSASKEHIWLTDIEKKGNKYYGTVANDPSYIKNMKKGDRVEFNINQVSDWKYVKDGYLVGGESIVYFYNQMSAQEKKDFERNARFKIRKK